MARLGILGGSFNPIHYGHLLMADEVLEQLALDRVLFVPAAQPPHKPASALAPAADRYAMVSLATAVFDTKYVRRLDGPNKKTGKNKMDLAEQLMQDMADFKSRHGLDRIVIVWCGSTETYLDLLSWRSPRRVAELARLVVVPRAGSAFDPESAAAQKVLREIGAERIVTVEGPTVPDRAVLLVHATSLPLSSSELRRRAREGRSLAFRLPDALVAYIRARRLYQDV